VLPSDPFALFILVAIFPGWLFARLTERRSIRPERSGLDEFLEWAGVGIGTTLIASLVVGLIATHDGAGARTLDSLFSANDPAQAIREHLAQLASAILAIELLATVIALLLFLAIYRGKHDEFRAAAVARPEALGNRPKGTHPYVAVHTESAVYHGVLKAYDLPQRGQGGDVALEAPILLEQPPGSAPIPINCQRLLVQGTEVRAVAVHHAPFGDANPRQ
jgi:hypothetical protein